MSIEERQERVSRIEAELDEAEEKLAGWERKKQAALTEFEAALDEGDETPHEESSVLSECRFAENHFKAIVAKRKVALKQAKEALAEERYSQGVAEIRKVRQEAADEIAEIEGQLVKQISDSWERAWRFQREANAEIERFNVRTVYAVGAQAETKISRMNGLSPDMFVKAVVEQALYEGKM
jgi:phosphatidylserine/phosphatidylglycerophosphate/cardiolipin synthase-like enzyme